MKFGYVSLEPIIDEAAGELKRLNRQGLFSRDDAYYQAVEASGLIGSSNYEDNSLAIEIKDHIGILPKEMVNANDVWSVEEADDSLTILGSFKCGARQFRPKTPMFPGDNATVRMFADRARRPEPFLGADTYVFKRPPGLIRTTQKQGWVGIHYNHLPKDDKGWICVQEEPNTIRAIKSYVKMMHMQDDYYAGQISQNIWNDVKDDWDKYSNAAKGVLKAPGPDDMHKLEHMINTRYQQFYLRRTC
jgi:hypothetical protein